MDIYISTYTVWDSYGAILQSYALDTCLRGNGFQSYDLVQKSNKFVWFYKPKTIKNLVMEMAGFYTRFPMKKRFKKINRFTGALCHYVKFADYDSLKNLDIYHDGTVFLSGSDQVWNPALCDPFFFLDFVPEKFKKISYAASLGISTMPDKNKQRVLDYVNAFSTISVREEEGKKILMNAGVTKPIEVSIDPTFLLSAEHYRSIEKKYKNLKPGSYVLLFPIYWEKQYNPIIKEYAKKNHLKILVVRNDFSFSTFGLGHNVFDAGIEEFLWLIDNANRIVTSSFHGAAFSFIFNKPVNVILNPVTPSRVDNMLDKFFADKSSLFLTSENLQRTIDYSSVNKIVAEERLASSSYLIKAVTDER